MKKKVRVFLAEATKIGHERCSILVVLNNGAHAQLECSAEIGVLARTFHETVCLACIDAGCENELPFITWTEEQNVKSEGQIGSVFKASEHGTTIHNFFCCDPYQIALRKKAEFLVDYIQETYPTKSTIYDHITIQRSHQDEKYCAVVKVGGVKNDYLHRDVIKAIEWAVDTATNMVAESGRSIEVKSFDSEFDPDSNLRNDTAYRLAQT